MSLQNQSDWVFLVLLLAMGSQRVAAQTLEERVVREALGTIYSGCDVALENAQAGQMLRSGKARKFALAATTSFQMGEEKFLAFVVTFADEHRMAYGDFLKGATVDIPTEKDLLIIAPQAESRNTTSIPIDSNALVTMSHAISVGDYLGDGTPLLKLEALSIYGLAAPREEIKAKRAYLYDVRGPRLLFAITEKRIAILNDPTLGAGTGLEETKWTLVKRAERRQLEVRTRLGNEDEVVSLIERSADGTFPFCDVPWRRRETVAPIPIPAKVTIRVLDEARQPMAGVSVMVAVRHVENFGLSAKEKIASAKTDDRGELSVDPAQGFRVEIGKQGYFLVRRAWYGSDVPRETEIVILERKINPVRMVTGVCTSISKESEALRVGTRLKGGGAKITNVNEIEHSDVWIEILQPGDVTDWDERIVRIQGRRGWRVCPGPSKDKTLDGDNLRVAPQEGFRELLEFRTAECPQGFYLMEGDGNRYGKIWGFDFERRGAGERSEVLLAFRFAVQAEPSGSHSVTQE